MQVRVLVNCSQPIDRAGRNRMLREDQVVDWDRDGELPKYFAAVEDESTDTEVVAVEPPISPVPPSLHALDRDSQILEAFNRMDHGNAEQWTSQGLPRVEVVSYLLDGMGFSSEVTRAEINVARPGFARE